MHTHYRSTNGFLRGHIASFAIYGAPRVQERGEFYYENFPAALINDRFSVSVFTLNPFVRPTRQTVLVVHEQGVWESEEITIRGKGVGEWTSRGSSAPGWGKPVGIIGASLSI